MVNPIGTLAVSNWGGLAIYAIENGINDKVKFRWEYGEKAGRMCTAILRYDNDGRAYFNSGRQRWNLDDFVGCFI